MVRSNPVLRMNFSTPDGSTTQDCQHSQQPVQDAVHIPPHEDSGLRPDLGTRSGQWGERAGKPTSCYTTAGTSIFGPQPSSHGKS